MNILSVQELIEAANEKREEITNAHSNLERIYLVETANAYEKSAREKMDRLLAIVPSKVSAKI